MLSDWRCPNCHDSQFARNSNCRKCGTRKPFSSVTPSPQQQGDWTCPGCHDLQFSRNMNCRKCRTPKPQTSSPSAAQPPQQGGDWNCPSCQDLQFARNIKCRRCGTPKPSQQSPSPLPLPLSTLNSVLQPPQQGGDWNCPSCQDLQFARNTQCRRCGTPKPSQGISQPPSPSVAQPPQQGGDWNCPSCQDLQFARNIKCRRCGTPKPSQPSPSPLSPPSFTLNSIAQPQQGGDWNCPSCQDLQFARNTQCRHCGTPKPSQPSQGISQPPSPFVAQPPQQEGDWNCPSCQDLQFARNTQCRRCGTPKPSQPSPSPLSPPSSTLNSVLQPPQREGDWNCPSCQDLQFARNTQCRRCGTPKPSQPSPSPLSPPSFTLNSVLQPPQQGGDWNCPSCQDLQFARNTQCRRCGTPKPSSLPPSSHPPQQGRMSGDWDCPNCHDHQFARNGQCRKCGTPKPFSFTSPTHSSPFSIPSSLPPPSPSPPPQLEVWRCSACQFDNPTFSTECSICETPRPQLASSTHSFFKLPSLPSLSNPEVNLDAQICTGDILHLRGGDALLTSFFSGVSLSSSCSLGRFGDNYREMTGGDLEKDGKWNERGCINNIRLYEITELIPSSICSSLWTVSLPPEFTRADLAPLYTLLKMWLGRIARAGNGSFSMSLVGISRGGGVTPENCVKELCSLLEFAIAYVPQLVKINIFMSPQTEQHLRSLFSSPQGGQGENIRGNGPGVKLTSLGVKRGLEQMASTERTEELMRDLGALVEENKEMGDHAFFRIPLSQWGVISRHLDNSDNRSLFAFTCCVQGRRFLEYLFRKLTGRARVNAGFRDLNEIIAGGLMEQNLKEACSVLISNGNKYSHTDHDGGKVESGLEMFATLSEANGSLEAMLVVFCHLFRCFGVERLLYTSSKEGPSFSSSSSSFSSSSSIIPSPSPSSSPSSLGDSDEGLCVICFEKEKNCVFVPCGHLACCYIDGITFEGKECLICRQQVGSVLQVYSS